MTQEELNKILELHKKWLFQEEDGVRADLSGADLSGLDLSYKHLREINLTGANLTRADLTGVNLSRANLTYANLSYAKLSDTGLICADLKNANLSDADLTGANLQSANLTYVKFSKPIILLQTDKYPLQFNFNINELRIGCEIHSFEYWLEKGTELADKRNYPKEEQDKLRKMITSIIEVYS